MSTNRKGCLPALIYMLLILGLMLAFVFFSRYDADNVYTEENHQEQFEINATSLLVVENHRSADKSQQLSLFYLF